MKTRQFFVVAFLFCFAITTQAQQPIMASASPNPNPNYQDDLDARFLREYLLNLGVITAPTPTAHSPPTQLLFCTLPPERSREGILLTTFKTKQMKPITQLIYAAALLCCMAGCTKKDPLPDATQQGLNTFGCNIDGVAWIPTGTSGPGGTKPVSAGLRQDGTFRIYAGSPEYLLVMNVPNVTTNKTGEYNLGNLTDNFGNFFTKATNIDYLTDKSNLGKVVITKMDTTKRIVSGTFYFKAKDVKSDKVIDISNGRFDVSY